MRRIVEMIKSTSIYPKNDSPFYRYTKIKWVEKEGRWIGYNFYKNKNGEEYRLGPFNIQNEDPPTDKERTQASDNQIFRIRIFN